jgi:N6-L-threonylcarbamoyladenine synthase
MPLEVAKHLLAIETSCDETATAVVSDDGRSLGSTIASQVEEHERFGGVVPEIASRAHQAALLPAIERTLAEAGLEPGDLDALAVTRGPGLIGALVVGVAMGKALGLAWGVPVVGVNHLEGHLLSILLADEEPAFPCLTLLVSGGHCFLVRTYGIGRYELLGQTRDDSIGEAYDKVARYLGLGYPGGPVLDALAAKTEGSPLALPRPMIAEGLDFSFSGLKTAVVNEATKHPELTTGEIAYAFVEAAMDVLLTKMSRALAPSDRALAVVGGVAASPILRERVRMLAAEAGCTLLLPSQKVATDNAAMIGVAGWALLQSRGPDPLDFGPDPNLAVAWSTPKHA